MTMDTTVLVLVKVLFVKSIGNEDSHRLSSWLTSCDVAISILYPHRKFWRSLYRTNFLEISNGRKTVRMAPILTIFGPNESQRRQLKFEKNLGRRKNFREGEKFEKVSRKVRKILARTRFLGRNKIETLIRFHLSGTGEAHACKFWSWVQRCFGVE